MDNAKLKAWLRSLGACCESLEWIGDRDLVTAWTECPRGDWLLWLAAKVGIDRRRLVMTACATAREAMQFVPAGEDRPRIAIETAEAWCRGEATIEQVREARRNAADAYAAYAAATAAALSAMRQKTAEIVRGLIALDEVKAAMGAARLRAPSHQPSAGLKAVARARSCAVAAVAASAGADGVRGGDAGGQQKGVREHGDT